MFQGLRTVIYNVADLETAQNWYVSALGFKPYFDEPFYAGFNVGGYELGLVPHAQPAATASEGGAAYWGVENIAAEFTHLLMLGAKEHSAVRDVGGDISVAAVLDLFGNIVGLIHNPNFKIG